MEKQITELNGKLQALNFRIGKTAEAIEKRERDAAERCCESLHKAINAVSDLRETIEDKKFGKGDSAEDVNDWASKLNIDDTLNRADQCSKQLKTLIAEIVREAKQADELHDHQHALELEQEKLQMQHEATAKAHAEQLEFERKRLELQQQQHEGLSTSQHGIASGDSAVKMPKLVISQFDGTHRDWMRFWGQFETQIDKSGVPGVTKFSYLKELVDPKVRNLIGGLPFTDEGYSKAKELLCRKFGNTSEIVGSYVRNILELPNIKERNVEGIHEFYETLLFNVESLRTMGELKKLDAAVRFTFDKLQVIKMELTMVNENWAEWDFDQFLSVLEKWSINNPVLKTKYSQREKGKAFWSNEEGKRDTGNWPRASGCFYCESNQHKAVNCDKVKSNDERKKILSTKRLCYNCMGARHRASDCKSKNTCRTCNGKHHTSICDKDQNPPRESGMTANLVGDNGAVVHPVVVVRIDGYKFRALLDSGASHSYISSTGIDLIKAKPHSTGLRQIAMLTGTTTRTMQTFNVLIESVSSDFQLEVNVTKVEKRELIILGNPGYPKLLEGHSHLRGVVMDDVDEKDNLPVHIILGANDFAKIRTSEKLRVGRRGDPVAEFTRFGWTIMSPGASAGSTNAFLTLNSATSDYEQLCALDVLGLAEQSGSQAEVYDEFKETLKRSPEGWYEVALPWKGNCPELLDNYSGSLQRLNSLLRKLRRTDMLEEYDAVIREQLENGVVERVPAGEEGKRFYLPHRAVLRDSSSSTRLRVVYDASARAQDQAPSLNECLHTGPPLNNQLWSVMIRQRFHPVAVAGDLRKAFLQIRVREADRDVLRFHWIRDKNSRDVEALRFTRVLFGLGPSPFLLNGVLQQHLENLSETYPETVREIRDSLYVDDLISGAPTTGQARQLKREAVEIFEDGKITLHKWNSNVRELETDGIVTDLGEQSFAKEQFNAVQGESKLLGLGWNKAEDKLLVNFPSIPAVTTRRGILASLAKVYDPLGLVSPVILEAKQLYRDACVKKLAWDAPLPQEILEGWEKWERGLPDTVATVRSIPTYQETIDGIQLHAFGDASGHGVCATVYAVVAQASGVSRGLIAAKSRLAKEGLTIPRLELVAGHMVINLASNVRVALEGFPVAPVTHCWLDSTVALHWIHDNGEYRQFVANRVRKIQSHPEARWHHVPTKENPADLGSRGGGVSGHELWWKGPAWLPDQQQWPPQIVTKASPQSTEERKVQRELFAAVVEVNNDFDRVLDKFGLRKAMRIGAWISRFTHNSRNPSNKIQGPLTTNELAKQELFCIKRAQSQGMSENKFTGDKEQLNLQVNGEGVWVCHGRIQGELPIYLPDSSPVTAEMVKRAHETSIHGGVSLTMAKVREKFWVPRLRRLAKRIVKYCWGCKRFHAVSAGDPPPGYLPRERTEGTVPFDVIGVDFAGPIKYRNKKKEEKAHVVLYSCCQTRGVFLEVLPSLETPEFLQSLKRLIARRGRPSRIYSDNGSTFKAAAKWLRKVKEDERFHEFLSDRSITWNFNVSRAPWWGGHFERLIGVMKAAFYKSVGQGLLSWSELCELILDIEISMNNRPLCYLEEDAQLPTLTPNSFLFLNTNYLPELEPHSVDDRDLRKRARFLKTTKEAMWRRWTGEYLRALRERHQLKNRGKENQLAVGDVVIIKSDDRNRNNWPLGIVEELYVGRDDIVRAAKLRAGRGHMERAIKHLYRLELSCDLPRNQPSVLNPEAVAYRPRRDAAAAAGLRVRDILDDDDH